MTQTDSPDFNSIDQLLNAANASWEAAEAHGAFCGRACLTGAGAIKTWVGDVLPGAGDIDVLAAERHKILEQLAAKVLLSLEAGDMTFDVFVPGDEEPLSVRTAGLVDWCHGFMQGLVMAGGADEGAGSDALETDVVSEILADFSEITKAGAADDADEQVEQAYTELVEYVRVSVQLVYDETASLRASQTAAGGNA